VNFSMPHFLAFNLPIRNHYYFSTSLKIDFLIFGKGRFWSLPILLCSKNSPKWRVFELVKPIQATLFSLQPSNLESILLWYQPKSCFFDFWKESISESLKTFWSHKQMVQNGWFWNGKSPQPKPSRYIRVPVTFWSSCLDCLQSTMFCLHQYPYY